MRESGQIISSLRKEAGFTQKSLAEALNVTDKAVSKWERGISLPDTTLLPKLSLLLDADVEHLIAKDKALQENWVGVIDWGEDDLDFSYALYDKPLINYFLIHYYLLGIKDIYIATSAGNREFLKKDCYKNNFNFHFDNWIDNASGAGFNVNAMIVRRPLFLFGSDLTRKFQGGMTYGQNVKLVPENCEPTTFFCLSNNIISDYEKLETAATTKTLGKGVVCLDLRKEKGLKDASTFVEIYQRNTGLKIAEL